MAEMPDFTTVVNPRQRAYTQGLDEELDQELGQAAISPNVMANVLDDVAARIRGANVGPSGRIRVHIGVLNVWIRRR